MNHQPCPHCQSKFLPTTEEIEQIVKMTKVDESQKTDELLYKERLAACKSCAYFEEDILCMQCGCFVAVRALYKNKKCPHPNGSKWL